MPAGAYFILHPRQRASQGSSGQVCAKRTVYLRQANNLRHMGITQVKISHLENGYLNYPS